MRCFSWFGLGSFSTCLEEHRKSEWKSLTVLQNVRALALGGSQSTKDARGFAILPSWISVFRHHGKPKQVTGWCFRERRFARFPPKAT